MADYKLKLEIDAAVLQKQLETAFKKGFKGFSGGSGGSGGAGGNDQQYYKQQEKIKKQTTKLSLQQRKELEKHTYTLKTEYAKQKSLLRAQNIMLEKSGVQQQRTFRMIGSLLGGRMGGAGGAGMDQIITLLSSQRKRRGQVKATQQAYDNIGPGPMAGINRGPRPEQEPNLFNAMADIGGRIKDSPIGSFLGSTKKTFEDKVPGAKKTGDVAGKITSKIPQAVKIAGIGAALAGGAGLAKMIVDSSPMLKQMLKILNIGIMLILRPIGDFIGFMLRPLLLEFVTKVAVPAYREGAKMAKDLGPKFGKALLLLFTDLPGFFELAITNPIMGSLEKTWINIVTALKNLGSIFGGSSVAENEAWKNEQYELIDKKYPGLLDQGAIDAKLKPLSTGLVNTPVEIVDDDFMGPLEEHQISQTEAQEKTTTEVKTVGDKIVALPQQIADVVIGPLGDMFAGSLEHIVAGMNLPFVDATTRKAEEVFDAARDLAKDLPGKVLPTASGSMAIEEAAKAKEREAMDLRLEKANIVRNDDGSLEVEITKLSPAAQRILAAANEYKEGNACSGAQAQASGRFGAVDPLDTAAMGGLTGTGVFEKYDAGGGNTCMASREVMEYENFAAESRAQMEAYSKAIEESVETGGTIKEEYNKILMETSQALENQAQSTQVHGLMLEAARESETNVQLMTDATQNMADNLNATAKYVANLLRKAHNIKNKEGQSENPEEGEQADGLEDSFSMNSGTRAITRDRYKITLGDGRIFTPELNSSSFRHLNEIRNSGGLFKGSPILSIMKMAAGGLITEPIFGIGQNTGKGYLMGEAGPERVTPGTGPARETSGGNTFNITINASGIGDIERQLKPAILKMLKESTSRAGIV